MKNETTIQGTLKIDRIPRVIGTENFKYNIEGEIYVIKSAGIQDGFAFVTMSPSHSELASLIIRQIEQEGTVCFEEVGKEYKAITLIKRQPIPE